MEIWGGNEAFENAIGLRGLEAWVFSRPYGGGSLGGDIHYISTCGHGHIARFMIADVAGHGPKVGPIATELRRLMRRNINKLDQTRFVRALNQEFQAFATDGTFATAILTSYFAPTHDLLVCNAGIASRGRSVADTDPEEMIRVVTTHAFGPHHMCRLVLPSMRARATAESGRGDIIMISSVATSHMGANGAPYNMGKAAMEALASTLAKEERRNNIHVNTVAPGLVETDMGVRLARAMTGNREMEDLRSMDAMSPFGRVCQPADIAEAVLWLCSPGSGYVTGQRIEVDGGGRF